MSVCGVRTSGPIRTAAEPEDDLLTELQRMQLVQLTFLFSPLQLQSSKFMKNQSLSAVAMVTMCMWGSAMMPFNTYNVVSEEVPEGGSSHPPLVTEIVCCELLTFRILLQKKFSQYVFCFYLHGPKKKSQKIYTFVLFRFYIY